VGSQQGHIRAKAGANRVELHIERLVVPEGSLSVVKLLNILAKQDSRVCIRDRGLKRSVQRDRRLGGFLHFAPNGSQSEADARVVADSRWKVASQTPIV